MTIDEQREYLRTMKRRYQETDRKTRDQLSDEMRAVTRMHRKGLVCPLSANTRCCNCDILQAAVECDLTAHRRSQ